MKRICVLLLMLLAINGCALFDDIPFEDMAPTWWSESAPHSYPPPQNSCTTPPARVAMPQTAEPELARK